MYVGDYFYKIKRFNLYVPFCPPVTWSHVSLALRLAVAVYIVPVDICSADIGRVMPMDVDDAGVGVVKPPAMILPPAKTS